MNFIKLLSGDAEITQYVHSDKDYVFCEEELSFDVFHNQSRGSFVTCVYDYGRKGAFLCGKAPRDGEYYIALQVRDTFGTYDEEYIPVEDKDSGPFAETLVELSVGGKSIGHFRYGRDDKKYYFFVTEEKIPLKKGDEICYSVVSGERVLFTAIVLMAEKPPIQTNRIMNLTTDNGEVRFRTTLACRARILLGKISFEENDYLNNHRFTIPEEYWGVRFVIELTDEDGNMLCGRGTCHEKAVDKKSDADICVKLCDSNNKKGTFPVMSVLPVSEGEIYQSKNICICDEKGNYYPTQCKVTSKWKDGSIKTAALQAILPLGNNEFFIKNDAADVAEEFPFSAVYNEKGVTVTNGSEVFTLLNESTSPLPDKDISAVLYDKDKERYIACGGAYEIDEQGINHIVITRVNRFMNGKKRALKCLTHLHFYRGISAYKLEFGFENDLMNNEFFVASGIYLEGEGSGESTDVFQLDEKWAIVNGTEKELQHSGEFSIYDKPFIIEDFWQNYPKSVNAADGKTKIGICPFIIKKEHYQNDDVIEESKRYFYLKTGNYEFHGGMRKYHSLIFGSDAKKLCDIAFLNPMPEEVEKSGAFGRIKCTCEDFPEYDSYMDKSLSLYYEHREKYRDYGMLNYGDSWGEGNIHWMNLEYDFHYGLMLHFLRTGDKRFYDVAVPAMAHYSEIDTCRRSVRFEEDGYYFVHTVGHANNYYPHELIPKSYPKIKFQMGHMFNHGLALFYKMTGIERYRETVLGCADALAKYYVTKFDFLTEREPGWCMLALQAAYDITLDEYYLNACRIMAERVMLKQNKETGCLWYMMPHPRPKGEERTFCYGGKPFMHGVLGDAIKNLYYLTDDERLRECAVLIAKWLAEEMYDDELREFWYSTPFKEMEKRVSQPETSMEILDAVLFGVIEGGKDYMDIVKKAFDKMLASPYRFENDVAKVFAMRLRFSPEIMYDYAKAKEIVRKG